MSTIEGRVKKDFNIEEIWLAGGCFWGTEDYISKVKGVVDTKVGYANGQTLNPSYEEVCTGDTGFVEAVYVCFDKSLLSLEFLLEVYFKSINPTLVNRQGNDVGSQYRTGIYYKENSQKEIIEKSIKTLQKDYDNPIVVEVKELKNFYMAEEYHQKYLEKNPGGYCHIPSSLIEYARSADIYSKKSDDTLKKELTSLQYEVTRENRTEPPFNNEYDDVFDRGIYVDVTTGEPLFMSSDKFNSGCGWPAFSKPINKEVIKEVSDSSHGMSRVEVRSVVGDSHLGHVFEDGPKERGGLRYCINSASLKFIPFENMEKEGYGYLIDLF